MFFGGAPHEGRSERRKASSSLDPGSRRGVQRRRLLCEYGFETRRTTRHDSRLRWLGKDRPQPRRTDRHWVRGEFPGCTLRCNAETRDRDARSTAVLRSRHLRTAGDGVRRTMRDLDRSVLRSGAGAAYSVRAVENPSCQWSWPTCLEIPKAERPKACSDPEIPRTIQKPAWTSPIWFEPGLDQEVQPRA